MTYSQSLDPNTNSTITIKLYSNVKNVPKLRKEIIDGSLNCCIVKPSLIVDPFQIVIAANKTLVAEKLTTKTIYTELLFNLSVSSNITASLQKFGVHDNDTDILVVVINKHDCGNDADKVFEEIDGQEIDISRLNNLSNEVEIKKAYRLSDVEVKEISLLDSVVSRIATKDCI